MVSSRAVFPYLIEKQGVAPDNETCRRGIYYLDMSREVSYTIAILNDINLKEREKGIMFYLLFVLFLCAFVAYLSGEFDGLSIYWAWGLVNFLVMTIYLFIHFATLN